MSGMGRREFVALLGGAAARGRSLRARSSAMSQSLALSMRGRAKRQRTG